MEMTDHLWYVIQNQFIPVLTVDRIVFTLEQLCVKYITFDGKASSKWNQIVYKWNMNLGTGS